jgi:hypothetical protein
LYNKTICKPNDSKKPTVTCFSNGGPIGVISLMYA